MRRPKRVKPVIKETNKDENNSVTVNKKKRRPGGCGCGGRRQNRNSEQ